MAPPSNPPPAPARKLITFHNDDALFETLEEIARCDNFDFEGFLADSPSSCPGAAFNNHSPIWEPLTEFTLFPKLCAELRLKIWGHAYADLKGCKLSIIPPLAETPSLLRACLDSRKVGLSIYKRQEHNATPSVPAFVSIIDFEKDIIDMTYRGVFENPQTEEGDESEFLYKPIGTTRICELEFRNNLLLYVIYHYPQLCKQIKRLMLRSCYMSGPSEETGDWFPVCEIFDEYFPVIENVGTVSSGYGERDAEQPPIRTLTRFQYIELIDDGAIHDLLRKLNDKGLVKYSRLWTL
ncbi:hypothetical protein VTL71DRAFT_510 [Oculimacula yallundae]|uniref:2EXR domain-containing protein n=1 Tax=Oculimacula yallundae TaxID=86028 RepID=A0ABR4D0A4_9HELO